MIQQRGLICSVKFCEVIHQVMQPLLTLSHLPGHACHSVIYVEQM